MNNRPELISDLDWNFDAVPDGELVACCHREYAPESAFIRDTQPTKTDSGPTMSDAELRAGECAWPADASRKAQKASAVGAESWIKPQII